MTAADIPQQIRDQDAESVRGDLVAAREEIGRLVATLSDIRHLAQRDIDGSTEGVQTSAIEYIARTALKDPSP